jgi:hypothetical protein
VLDDKGSRFPAEARGVSRLQKVQTGSGVRRVFPRSLSSAEVKNEWRYNSSSVIRPHDNHRDYFIYISVFEQCTTNLWLNALINIILPETKANEKAVPWLRRLVVGLSPRRHGFDRGSVHVGFVVDKVALGQVFL